MSKSLFFLAPLMLLAFTACGENLPFSGESSLYSRQVPLEDEAEAEQAASEDSQQEEQTPEEEEPVEEPSPAPAPPVVEKPPVQPVDPPPVVETPQPPQEEKPPVQMVSLKDKILMNSDLDERALDNAFEYFETHKSKISNQKVMTIFDIGQHSGRRRLYVINLETGYVSAIHVAHGKNSDKNHNGYAESFSNQSGSLQSSLGFMITGSTYYGSKGYSLNLHGQENRNDNVYSRRVVIHGADYVSPDRSKMGRSWGCPAVSRANTKWFINKIKNGSLLYIYNAKYDG